MLDERVLVRVHTERGMQLGLRQGFGPDGNVEVFLPTSGSVVSVPASRVSAPMADDMTDYSEQLAMLEKIRDAEEAMLAERRSTANAALIARMLVIAEERGYRHTEIGSFHRVESKTGSRCLYISKNGRRVDMTDFCVSHRLVTPIDEATARLKRLGKVRGQALSVQPEELQGLWEECLDALV